MRILFRILTMIWLLVSLFLFIMPVIILPMQSGLSWHVYVYEGLKTVPDGAWGAMFDSNKYPDWLTLLYWAALIIAVFAAWRPSRR